MTNRTQTTPEFTASFGKPMLVGAAIGAIVISMFLMSADEPDPAWRKLWMIRPAIVCPLAGALGGLFYFFMNYLSAKRLVNKILANSISLLAFIVAIWLGIVLGFVGTMWN